MRIAFALLLASLFAFANVGVAQTSASSSNPDSSDVRVFRILFRRDIQFRQLADEAEAGHAPKPYLRRLLSTQFHLNSANSEALDRISSEYQRDLDPIHKQALASVAKFKSRYPSGVLLHGFDNTAPPELTELQHQENALVLHYRNQLRNEMGDHEFLELQKNVRTAFGNSVGGKQ